MGQKVNPHGLRVGVIKDWDSRWFEKDEKFGDTLVNDYKVREYLKKKLFLAGVPKIEIERDSARVRVFIHCAKPGIVIGRDGAEIKKLRAEIEKIVGRPVDVNVVEIRTPDLNAQLVAENIAAQLEKRTSFRRAMKMAISRTMKLGAKGIKVSVGGRLGGAEIARTEHYHEGTIPLQTLRADIDYGFWEANTTYGKIGVKVWIYNGEVLMDSKTRGRKAFPDSKSADHRGDHRGDRRSDRRGNGDRREGGNNRGNFGGNRGGFGGGNRGGNRGGFGGNRSFGDRQSAPRTYTGSNRAAAPVRSTNKEGGAN